MTHVACALSVHGVPSGAGRGSERADQRELPEWAWEQVTGVCQGGRLGLGVQ